MPSLFKKLLYGKELSNPYCNPYHTGHTHVSTETAPALFQGQAQAQADPFMAHHIPSHHHHHHHHHRPPSPSHLEEARRLAGRDPVTGRALRASTSTPASASASANTRSSPVNHAPASGPSPSSSSSSAHAFRSDVLFRDQRRRREEKEALMQAQRELEGYFSPVIQPVGRR